MKNEESKKLTNDAGAPVADNTNSVTAGECGPMAMQNPWFLEKLGHFDREVIPERRMHAKGSGAFGTFTVTNDITKYTKAKLFSQVGKKTDIFMRFSTVAGERGAADAERDIRGFAMKYYTEDGNWDLVGNNTPVFFLRDGLRFPDLNHAIKRDPKTNMRSPQNNWDFWSMLPEALHQVTITMSDRGIPLSYRHMHGFGSHTYSMINDKNQRVWVKFHFRTQQGIKNLTDTEAADIVAKDRESHQRDLFDSIERGDFPRWTMQIQVMTEEQAKNHYENPFDVTKIWRHSEFPLIDVGTIELNRNPENYFADVEQAAFNPAHNIPGIGFSPDKLLQARLFSYGDAQRYRLGVNHHQIPVNAPKNGAEHFYHRDGTMRVDGNFGATTSYQPNSMGEWTEQPEYKEPPLELSGAMDSYEPKDNLSDDCFKYPGDLYRLMTAEQRQALIENTRCNMMGVSENIRLRHAAHCYIADDEYGSELSDALGVNLDCVIHLSKLSHSQRMQETSSSPLVLIKEERTPLSVHS
ncbi:MAG: catalase [Oscillospiraceae bacterium]|jgi:catalase|nr:catalase [Oscillospiraceae bacterium]